MSEHIAMHRSLSGRKTSWLTRMGKLGFAFFFVKGMVWLMLPVVVWLID
jgi:hypothetical protein